MNAHSLLILLSITKAARCTGGREPLSVSALKKRIFADYDRTVRPAGHLGATNVTVHIELSHIGGVDERAQTFDISFSIWANWTDERLRWTPVGGAGGEHDPYTVPVKMYQVWRPNVHVFNSASLDYHVQHRGESSYGKRGHTTAGVSFNGVVWTDTDVRTVVSCRGDVTLYPYDRRYCDLVLGAELHNATQVDLGDEGYARQDAAILALNWYGSAGTKDTMAGWRLRRTYRNHLYTPLHGGISNWEENGVTTIRPPKDKLKDYRSTVFYFFELERSLPYFGVRTVLPILLSGMLTCASLSLHRVRHCEGGGAGYYAPFAAAMASLYLQALHTWDTLKELPTTSICMNYTSVVKCKPGAIPMPKIVIAMGFNLAATFLVLLAHIALSRLRKYFPSWPARVPHLSALLLHVAAAKSDRHNGEDDGDAQGGNVEMEQSSTGAEERSEENETATTEGNGTPTSLEHVHQMHVALHQLLTLFITLAYVFTFALCSMEPIAAKLFPHIASKPKVLHGRIF